MLLGIHLGQAIETGLGIAKHAGNALEGKESFGEAIPNIISSLGGNPCRSFQSSIKKGFRPSSKYYLISNFNFLYP